VDFLDVKEDGQMGNVQSLTNFYTAVQTTSECGSTRRSLRERTGGRDIRELFPTDDPVKPRLLIGRGEDVRDLAARLREGTHMVMAGPRRTGKSTCSACAPRRTLIRSLCVSRGASDRTAAPRHLAPGAR